VETVVTGYGSTDKSAVSSYRVTLQRVVLTGNLLRFDMALWNTTEEDVRAVLRRDPQNEIEAYIVDSLSIRTRAVSTSLTNTSLYARPGEKVPFYIVFPVPGTNLKRVSVASLWILRSPSATQAVSVIVAGVALPDVIAGRVVGIAAGLRVSALQARLQGVHVRRSILLIVALCLGLAIANCVDHRVARLRYLQTHPVSNSWTRLTVTAIRISSSSRRSSPPRSQAGRSMRLSRPLSPSVKSRARDVGNEYRAVFHGDWHGLGSRTRRRVESAVHCELAYRPMSDRSLHVAQLQHISDSCTGCRHGAGSRRRPGCSRPTGSQKRGHWRILPHSSTVGRCRSSSG